MLYVLHGSLWQKIAKRIEEIKTETGPHVFFRADARSFSEDKLKEWISFGKGLFDERALVYLDQVFESEEAEQCILSYAKKLISSETVFILREEKILVKIKKALDGGIFEEFEGTDTKRDKSSIFSLTDALCARDKKKAWALLIQFLENTQAEEVHGVLWWQVKTILALARSPKSSAESLGMKPFTLSKSKTALQKYTKDEIKDFADDLVFAYHDAHRGIGTLPHLLEQILLRRV